MNTYKILMSGCLVLSSLCAQGANHFSSGLGLTSALGVSGMTARSSLASNGELQKTSPATTFRGTEKYIDFERGALGYKGYAGLGWLVGVVGQYAFDSGFLAGVSVNYGRVGRKSKTMYQTTEYIGTNTRQFGKYEIDYRLETTDKGYISELLNLGYAFGRASISVLGGMAQHRLKTAYLGENGQSLSKGINTGVIGLAVNFAMSKNWMLGVQWQRHTGGTVRWNNVNGLVPENVTALGAPKTKFRTGMILCTLTYISSMTRK